MASLIIFSRFRTVLSLLVLISIIYSCKKESDTADPPPAPSFPGKLIHDKGDILRYEILPLDDGNFLLSVTHNTISRNLELIKLSPSGDEIWTKVIVDHSKHFRHTSMLSHLNEIYITAHTFDYQSGTRGDVALFKVSLDGILRWHKYFPLPEDQQVEDMTLTHDNKLMIVGRNDSANNIINADLFLQKFDLDGNSLWNNLYNYNGIQLPNRIVATSNGSFMTLGSSNAQGFSSDFAFYLSKYSATGNFVWEKRQSYGSQIRAYNMKRLAEGDFITWGRKGDVKADGLLLKIDQDGEIVWNKTHSLYDNYTQFNNLAENSDGTYSVIGRTTESNGQEEIWNFFFAKFSSNGDLLNWKEIPGSEGLRGTLLVQDQDGDLLLFNKLDGKIYLARMNQNGDPITL